MSNPDVIVWAGVFFGLGGLIGWFGGYCFGWVVATKDTERRWSEAVARADDARARKQGTDGD